MGLFDSIVDIASDIFGADQERKENTKAREQQQRLADQNALNQERWNQENIELQREFAKNGIRWKVEDAEAAGLHPLAALGTNSPNFSPTSYIPGDTTVSPDHSRSNLARNMGQNISRAIRSTQTAAERARDGLALERMELENDLLKAQIGSIQRSQQGPPFPSDGSFDVIPGQGADAPVNLVPAKRIMSPSDAPYQEAGDRPDLSFSRSKTGRVPMIPEGLSESLEDDMIGRWMWRARNQIINNFGFGAHPSEKELPRGAIGWKWNVPRQEWQPDYGKFDPLSIVPWKYIKQRMRR